MFLLESKEDVSEALEQLIGKSFVCKPRYGMEGSGIEFVEASFDKKDLLNTLLGIIERGTYIVEEHLDQHPVLNELNSSSLNTLRIVTMHDGKETVFLKAALRIGNGKKVDNVSAGGIIAPVDIDTGIISGPAKGADVIRLSSLVSHPITGIRIPGLTIPYWQEVISMIKEISPVLSKVKSVGWDIGITENGPALIEINSRWNARAIQMVDNVGIMEQLIPFMPNSLLYSAHIRGYKTNKFAQKENMKC